MVSDGVVLTDRERAMLTAMGEALKKVSAEYEARLEQLRSAYGEAIERQAAGDADLRKEVIEVRQELERIKARMTEIAGAGPELHSQTH